MARDDEHFVKVSSPRIFLFRMIVFLVLAALLAVLLHRQIWSAFLANPALEEEIFGPTSVIIACRDHAEMLAVARHLEGQLTATVHASDADHAIAASLLQALERKVGRILFNGFPTGVEVAHAMVHGGPFPATSDSRSTSVGATDSPPVRITSRTRPTIDKNPSSSSAATSPVRNQPSGVNAAVVDAGSSK